MSLIVKGISMPKGCWDCPFKALATNPLHSICLCRKGEKISVNLDTGVDDNCPLEMVKEDKTE